MCSLHFWACQGMVALSLIACQAIPPTDPIPSTSFKLALPIGRSWIYADSVRTIGAESSLVVRTVAVTVVGKDSLSAEHNDLLQVRIVTRAGNNLQDSFVWYRHDEAGLWEVAYRNGENVFAFPRFKGYGGEPLSPGTANEKRFLLNHGDTGGISAESTFIRVEPRLVVKYPLQTGEQWIAFNQPFRRTLKCLRVLLLQVPAGEFETYQLHGLGTSDPTANFEIYDYFSSDGLVRRDLYWRDLQAFSASGQLLPNPIDIEESIVLIDMVDLSTSLIFP